MSKFELGEHSYGSGNILSWGKKDTVKTGKFCSIAGGFTIFLDGNHRHDIFSTFPFRERLGWNECPVMNYGKKTPVIGNDVWIGGHATLMSGADISDGAVVAAFSMVTKTVPPYAIVAGNPARVVKYRFDPDTIDKLVKYKWWDLPLDVIRTRLIPHMDNMPEFVKELQNIRESNETPNK